MDIWDLKGCNHAHNHQHFEKKKKDILKLWMIVTRLSYDPSRISSNDSFRVLSFGLLLLSWQHFPACLLTRGCNTCFLKRSCTGVFSFCMFIKAALSKPQTAIAQRHSCIYPFQGGPPTDLVAIAITLWQLPVAFKFIQFVVLKYLNISHKPRSISSQLH